MFINAKISLKGKSKYKDTRAIQKALNYAKKADTLFIYLKELIISEKLCYL